MNVIAFILAFVGAFLNVFWPVIKIAVEVAKKSNISVYEALANLWNGFTELWNGFTEFMSSGAFDFIPTEIKITGIIFLAIPFIALISGLFVLTRKKESFFAKILALCACYHLYFTYRIYSRAYTSLMQSLMPDMFSVMSYIMFMFLSWGICYGLAAVFAYFDSIHIKHIEAVRNSEELKRLREDNETLKKILIRNNHEQESESPEEKKYSEAIEADTEAQRSRNVESMRKAAEMFDELGDYKDSRLQAESIRQQINTMQESNTNVLRIIISAVIVGLFITGIIIFDKIVHM